jgi:periplasmic protein TonB
MIKILILLTALPFTCLSQASDSNNDSIGARQEKFLMVEKTAEFPGGIGKFYKYVMKNLKYPDVAKRNGIEGKIYVEFVINQDGSIDDETVRALTEDELSKVPNTTNLTFDPGCRDEAIRLLRSCPDWVPASIKNKTVRQRMVLPIAFKI